MVEFRSGIPRAAELVVALLGFVLAAPVLAVAVLAIKLSSAGPGIHRQERVGLHGRTFTLFKLRTMRPGGGGPEVTAKSDHRITRVGRVLRKLKLDELPELWNVVRGDLSLVGPRPEVPRFVELERPVWRQVLSVRPGLTDPVTLRLRNEEELIATAEDAEVFYRSTVLPVKLRGYVEYTRRRTGWTDVVVLFQTAAAIVFPILEAAPQMEDLELEPAELFRLERWPVRRGGSGSQQAEMEYGGTSDRRKRVE